tara:strand:+ start:1103 stop:1840 length:738 start_codon:yes stop_codon:yes gene_type:complete
MKKINYICALIFMLVIASCNSDNAEEANDYKNRMKLASDWITAGYSGKDEAIAMVSDNMAEDGEYVGSRYVGFGFVWNPDGDGMVVDYVVPDSPASSVLQEGDSFIKVNGIELTNENRNRLGFRGKPGENVQAVVLRDGKEVPVSFARGPIQIKYSKKQTLDNFAQADADTWGPEDFDVIETSVTDNGVVYVLHWEEFIEENTEYKSNAFTITRFEFNESGKVTWIGELTEDRFVLEQQGWSISR